MTITYRLADRSEAAAVSALAQELFPDACPDYIPQDAIERFNAKKLNAAVFEEVLSDPERFVVTLAEDEQGKLLGYTVVDRDPDMSELPQDWVAGLPQGQKPTYLSKFYLHPDARGTGVSRELMPRVLEVARAAGAPAAFLGTNVDNARANAFYAKYGYEVIGKRVFDFEPGIECIDYIRAVTF